MGPVWQNAGMPEPPRMRSRAFHSLCLTEKDERDLDGLLRAAFPRLRTIKDVYWERHEDGDRVYPDRPDEPLEYVSGLPAVRDCGDPTVKLWNEPEGWEPEWYPSRALDPYLHRYGSHHDCPIRYYIGNEPKQQFRYDAGGYQMNGIVSGWLIENFNRFPVPPVIVLKSGYLSAVHEEGDIETKRFLDKVWRIIKKFATNKLIFANPYTNRFPRPPEKGVWTWAGPDAIDWCRLSPHHFLSGDYRPADEYDPDMLEELEEDELWRARWRMGWPDAKYPIVPTEDGEQ